MTAAKVNKQQLFCEYIYWNGAGRLSETIFTVYLQCNQLEKCKPLVFFNLTRASDHVLRNFAIKKGNSPGAPWSTDCGASL